jgi:hypothetical protein
MLSDFKAFNKTCDFIKVYTSKEKYNIASYGKKDDGSVIEIPIIEMTDFSTYSLDKKQIYISGLFHGDEVIGPNVFHELINLFCVDFEKLPFWIQNLLKSNLIIITPFTNAYGFYYNQRVK